MADSQNAHHPDKTQPLDAMSAAPKSPPAQMELLRQAASDEPKHNHDNTQPPHVIPPAALSPTPEAKTTPTAFTQPSREHQPEKTQPMHVMPPATASASASAHQGAAKVSEPAVATSAPNEVVKSPAPAVAATLPADAAKSLSSDAEPATSRPRAEKAKAAKASTPPPSRPTIARPPAPPSSAPSSHIEPVKAPVAQPSSGPSSSARAEAPKAPAPPAPSAPKDYVKTVAMMAASPPPTPTPTAASTAPPDIEQLRVTTPSSPVRDRFRWLGHRIAATTFISEVLPGAAAKLNAYAALTRLNKPIGIWLLLWPVLWALWLSSGGKPDPHVFIVFVLGTVLTRSAGCAINDYADRNFDGHVKRTKDRPLVTGAVDPVEALALCAGLGLIALGLALTLNQRTQLLTIAGGVLVLTYPFFKRFFPLPQMYLGIAFTWSVPMAFTAQTGEWPSRVAWVIFMAGLLWTVAYDTMYAMVDREDDKKLGIRSSALLFGDADRFIVGIMQLMTLLGLWLIGRELELGLWYGLGLAFAAMFALYQQFLIRKRRPEDCFKAFLNNNYFGMSVFIGTALEYTFR